MMQIVEGNKTIMNLHSYSFVWSANYNESSWTNLFRNSELYKTIRFDVQKVNRNQWKLRQQPEPLRAIC